MQLEIQRKHAFIVEYRRQPSGMDGMERAELLHNFLASVLQAEPGPRTLTPTSTVWEGEG